MAEKYVGAGERTVPSPGQTGFAKRAGKLGIGNQVGAGPYGSVGREDTGETQQKGG